jgi:sec-independent protein translocase protein TatA
MNLLTILAIPNLWSIALIVIVVLLLFGGKKIPELMKGLGQGMKEFKNAKKDISKEIEDKEEK